MIKKVAPDVWKIIANSNIYILNIKSNNKEGEPVDEWVAIDAGDRQYHEEVKEDISQIVDPEKITKLILTHLHYDHIGNIDLFPNAKIFAHFEEINLLKEDQFGTVLSEDLLNNFDIDIEALPDTISGLKTIHTPGHTGGSTCIFWEEKKILFSGDTAFFGGAMGRTDLPTSVPEKMEESLKIVYNIDYEILCPGHDY